MGPLQNPLKNQIGGTVGFGNPNLLRYHLSDDPPPPPPEPPPPPPWKEPEPKKKEEPPPQNP